MTQEQIDAVVAASIAQIEKAGASGNESQVRQLVADALKDASDAEAGNKSAAKGDRFARIARSLAATGGKDFRRAAEFAEKTLHDGKVAKALGTGTMEGGGFLVPEEFSAEIIELLRPRSVIRSMNPIIVPMNTGAMTMPRLAAGATASYVQESQAIRASQEKGQQLTLSWKKMAAVVPVSNDLLRLSSPSADMIVRNDLVLSLATREDQAFLRGDGSVGVPKGLRYWSVSGNVIPSAAGSNTTPTLANVDTDIKGMINALNSVDVRMINPGWIISPRTKNFFAFLRNTNGFLVYPTLSELNPTLLGYPVGVSNNVPNNLGGSSSDSEIYLADFADVIIAEATQLILEVSSEAAYTDSGGTMQSAFSRDETVVRAIARHDFALRHDVSVAVLTAAYYN